VSQANETLILHSAVRQQLEKILVHDLFARSDRMARFLRLAVEWTLEGNGDELKQYLVGVEVFDRNASYDPRLDPIVRVEARRLRSKLKAYYDGDGKSDPMVIELASGSYAPRFRLLAQEATLEAESPAATTVNESLEYVEGLMLFADLSEHRMTFTEFLDRFRGLPRAEQDRLLAIEPKPANAKQASA
jgi:hypothetical protein